ncbi:uncharacterized protein LOC131605632 [Vicia villosa]|uniref:uncharacterized protein LOC131605632 n=1 Tax=Vicia villosa TaxID=3911 RepID=UPI00273C4E85|nr:uncharacterized protein LOC131605632 [Vicia villosa]
MRAILNVRKYVGFNTDLWNELAAKGRFMCGAFYQRLNAGSILPWSDLCYHNPARPCAVIILWLLCHERLATRRRLLRFGFMQSDTCSFCTNAETASHLFFDCLELKKIWSAILGWIQIQHTPGKWEEELPWALSICKGEGWKAKLVKLALTETVYGVWHHRNRISFGHASNMNHIIDDILEKIVYRGRYKKMLKPHIATRMLG